MSWSLKKNNGGFSDNFKNIHLKKMLDSVYSSDSSSESNIEAKNHNLLMDSVKIYKVYYPHNNVNEIFKTIYNIEKMKQKRSERKKKTTEIENKNFFFRIKNAAGFLKKATIQQQENSIDSQSSKIVQTKARRETAKINEVNGPEDSIHKRIFRKIRESEQKDSLIVQILKLKQQNIIK